MRTFVVRLWEGAGEELTADPGPPPLRGVLEAVETGEAIRFTRAEELLEALTRAAKNNVTQSQGGNT